MKCVFCRETKVAIRAEKLFCCGIDGYTGECTWERDRHRFKPFSEKELERIAYDEREMVRQMGDFADFVKEQELQEQGLIK